MKQSEIINANFMKSPFAQGASYTNKTSKQWSDDEVKGGFKKILSTNGANNGYLTLEDLNRLGYNITESTFSDDIGLVPFFDSEYCNAIGGYPKGAHIFGILNGTLIEAVSLVDNNKVNFQKIGIDNINWYFPNYDIDSLLPSYRPKRKLITLDVGGKKPNSNNIDDTKPFYSSFIEYDKHIHYIADKDMYVGIDLSDFNYNPYTFNASFTQDKITYDYRVVSPLVLNMFCFIGDMSSDKTELSTVPHNPLTILGNSFLIKYAPRWNGFIYSFIAPGYKDQENFQLIQMGNVYKMDTTNKLQSITNVNPDLFLSIHEPFYMNAGDQLVIFTWSGTSPFGGDAYSDVSDNPTKIYFSEY